MTFFIREGMIRSPRLDRVNKKLSTMSLWYFSLLKVCTKTIKNSKHHLIQNNRSHFIKIIKRSGTCFQFSQEN